MAARSEKRKGSPPRAGRAAASPAPPKWTPARLHKTLRDAYGAQTDWWPVDRAWHAKHGTDARFEVVLGAILAQNTAWANVEKALRALKAERMVDPRALLAAETPDVERLLRSSGTYKQKARRVVEALRYFQDRGSLDLDAYCDAASMAPGQARRELLGLHGVGPETADTILLYALGFPSFVVDAYTKRILSRLGVMPESSSYDDVQRWFTSGSTPQPAKYREMHALLVEHAKARCKSEPLCAGCPLLAACPTGKGRTSVEKARPRTPPHAGAAPPVLEAPFLE